MNLEELDLRIRPAAEGDVSFIFNSWLKSYRNSLFAKPISNTVYFAEQHKVVENLLKTSTTLIICSSKEPTNIYGYICAGYIDKIFVLHYIYMKHPYRQFGLAKLLLNQFEHEPGEPAMASHTTRLGSDLAPKYGFVYSPYLALTGEYERLRKETLEKKQKKEVEAANEKSE